MAVELEVLDLAIERGYQRLVEKFNLTANEGTIVHITGQNGSGKSSILRTIAGLAPIYEGSIKWSGNPVDSTHSYTNYVNFIGHLTGLSPELTGGENLAYCLKLSSLKKRAMEITQALSMLKARNLISKPVRYLSAGEKQKLVLARLLLFDCPLWILDEPFNSLDGETRKKLETIINQHAKNGGIILMTSHQSFQTINSPQIISLER